MTVEQRIQAFEKLHSALVGLADFDREHWTRLAEQHNGWFHQESVDQAIDGLIRYLHPESFRKWVMEHELSDQVDVKEIGVIMAGNIPMVGIHDFIAVLVSGHQLHAKLSSQDPALIKEVSKMLIEIEPAFAESIHFVERMNTIDVLIATGSDNSARHFEYYFKDKPKIIRKNRTSVAVLSGNESEESLQLLGQDIMSYFGLGCRNVSKIFVPKGYDLTKIMATTEKFAVQQLNNHKYANNYDYNKSIYLINQVTHLDNGGLMLTEDQNFVSPISVLFYEEYDNLTALAHRLEESNERIQCVVSEQEGLENTVPFGKAQQPDIEDYADGIDTLAFLANS